MRDLNKEFGFFVKASRKTRKMTQGELADKAKLSIDTIGRIERGQFSPSIDTLTKILHSVEMTYEIDPSPELEKNSVRNQLKVLVNAMPEKGLPVTNFLIYQLYTYYKPREEKPKTG